MEKVVLLMGRRIENLRKAMQERKIEAFLVTSPANLRYISGFTGTTGLAVITMENAFFVTDFRYTEQAAEQCQGFQIVQNRGPIFEEVAKIVTENKLSNLAFEETKVTYAEYEVLTDLIDATFISGSGLIENLREVKDEEELSLIRKACEIADRAFEHILKYIEPGMTEIQVANELDFYMRSLGASGVSFDTIVASGVRSAMPHGVASDKKIQTGEFITLDYGCYYKGYVSDMTRTISLGEPSKKLREIYQIVLDAQLKVTAAAKAGVTGAQLDAIARDYITAKGYGEYFGHSTGHSIGLEVHETPNVSYLNDQALVAGNVITNEPGIYLPGIGGVRIEDDLIITENGCETIVHSPKELIIL